MAPLPLATVYRGIIPLGTAGVSGVGQKEITRGNLSCVQLMRTELLLQIKSVIHNFTAVSGEHLSVYCLMLNW